MSYWPKVKIWNDTTGLATPTHVSIDGNQLKGVRSIEYRADIDGLPTITLELYSLMNSGIDIDNVELRLKFHPQTIDEAIYVLEKEFGLDRSAQLKEFLKHQYGVDIE